MTIDQHKYTGGYYAAIFNDGLSYRVHTFGTHPNHTMSVVVRDHASAKRYAAMLGERYGLHVHDYTS